jgi:hypothetical protein
MKPFSHSTNPRFRLAGSLSIRNRASADAGFVVWEMQLTSPTLEEHFIASE